MALGSAPLARAIAAHPGCRWGAAFVALLALPLAVANGYQQYLLDLIMINIVLAVGLNIVKGFAGQVNVGHVALAAIGLAESVRIFIAVTDYLGASVGYGDIPPPIIAGWRLDGYAAYYYVVMPAAVIGTYIAFSILHSDVGRAFKAIREDTLAAAASGINVRKYKLLAFVISALYAGCAGSLAAHMAPGFIHPDDHNPTRMITVILMVVAGGLGHVWGGVIGAALITLVAEWTRSYYQHEFIIFGLIVVLTMMYMPRGIGGYIDRRLATRRFVALRTGKAAAKAI